MPQDSTAVRQEVNNLESSEVVQELDFAMYLALYVFCEALVTNKYIVGSLSWRSLRPKKIGEFPLTCRKK